MTNWNELAKAHHEAMVTNGFHDNYSHTDLLLRGIQEVGEATSVWRKNRRANMAQFYMRLHGRGEIAFENIYNQYIKGRIEEELADIACIMMDFAATSGGEIEVSPLNIGRSVTDVLMEIANFICRIHSLSDAPDYVDVKNIAIYNNYIFSNLESLAKDLSIDLEQQVRLKMQYNATRPFRHGDKN